VSACRGGMEGSHCSTDCCGDSREGTQPASDGQVMMRKFTNFESVYTSIFTVNLPAFTGKL
jgi:hypothetical protein